MSRMVEMIRNSSVPLNVLRTASRGGLALPPAEMLEVLVELALHSVFRDQAQLTLASWDNASIAAILRDTQAKSVLSYFLRPENLRPALVTTLCENAHVDEAQLVGMARVGTMKVLSEMLRSARVQALPGVLKTIGENPRLESEDRKVLQQLLSRFPAASELTQAARPDAQYAAVAARAESSAGVDISEYERLHAAEIAAENNRPFEVVLENANEKDSLAKIVDAAKSGEAIEDDSRLSVIQKIARMTVGQRVQLALKGGKDERFVLIRDGSKVVSVAVLDSPKVSEAEMEMFAAMKNVQEAVLRAIAGKRKYMKQYSVVRALANNPKCPLDIALTLLSHLLPRDLIALSKNKNIGDNLRKIAFKLYKDKTEKKNS